LTDCGFSWLYSVHVHVVPSHKILSSVFATIDCKGENVRQALGSLHRAREDIFWHEQNRFGMAQFRPN
jgi:hypothetical protein